MKDSDPKSDQEARLLVLGPDNFRHGASKIVFQAFRFEQDGNESPCSYRKNILSHLVAHLSNKYRTNF